MKKGQLIVFEGLSGTGKSCLSELLAGSLETSLTSSVPPAYDEARKFFYTSRDVNARYLLFMSALFAVSEQVIRPALEQGDTVVLESYIYRTIAFHRGMGAEQLYAGKPNIIIPDVIFFLECTEEVRKQRISKRLQQRAREKRYWDVLAETNVGKITQIYEQILPMDQVIRVRTETPEDITLQVILTHLQEDKVHVS